MEHGFIPQRLKHGKRKNKVNNLLNSQEEMNDNIIDTQKMAEVNILFFQRLIRIINVFNSDIFTNLKKVVEKHKEIIRS